MHPRHSKEKPCTATSPFFIDDEWCQGASGKSEGIVNRATGQVIARLAHADQSDLGRALAATDKGFKQWRAVSVFER